jgi:predicted  nucleic acid-binding Zn-ribbon protein
MKAENKESKIDFEKQSTIEKLGSLYNLQKIDSKVDEIRLIKGELPMTVRDLEDELVGLNTRLQNHKTAVESAESLIVSTENEKKKKKALIDKYNEQINHIKNNREFESLTRELNFETLEVELCDKNIEKYRKEIEAKKEAIAELESAIVAKTSELRLKKSELQAIQKESKQEEEALISERETLIKLVEPRLLYAYSRIRNSVINKIAVAHIKHEACSGCNSKIPPQRQIEIKSNRKIISCEFCGRIIVDAGAFEPKDTPNAENTK